MGRIRNVWTFLGLILLAVSFCDFHVSADVIPSENECRPYIEKAIHELKNVEVTGSDDKDSEENSSHDNGSIENEATPETGLEDDGNDSENDDEGDEKSGESVNEGVTLSDENATQENQTEENASQEVAQDDGNSDESAPETDSNQQNDSAETDDNKTVEDDNKESEESDQKEEAVDTEQAESLEDGEAKSGEDTKEENDNDSKENASQENDSKENDSKENDSKENESKENQETAETADASSETQETSDDTENSKEEAEDVKEATEEDNNESTQTEENQDEEETTEGAESEQNNDESNEEVVEQNQESGEKDDEKSQENETVEADDADDSKDEETAENAADDDSQEKANDENSNEDSAAKDDEEVTEEKVRSKRSIADEANNEKSDEDASTQNDDNDSKDEEKTNDEADSEEKASDSQEQATESQETNESEQVEDTESEENSVEQNPDEEDLTIEFEIPKNLRPRGHVSELLGLDAESSIKEHALRRTGDVVLKELKKVFDNAIKPLESMYKYRDLSNRHFGDPEIFSKPLILFMGPWSGGKSTILNYLTDNEYTANSIRSGAEPSPAYFNILMHGDEPEVLDGTQLAADWTFSGLQKFGQGLMDRLRGQKLPSKLLERVNIVEIPGILEVRKQVSRYFPFNDACQWFIDRADIIFLVYDPSKLDVGPETEAILDQLKGREYQTRILLNKADQVKPEELLRVQSALIWNISPLMSSAQPPVMYTVSLWSHPFENGAPIRLLQAQERALLSDLKEAIDKRIENKIASARRFAVRIRNHAKMVDCYLTTYYNQKGLFSNKKQVSDKIIEHPQNYNIYEGLSTLTNISRYDLPDPEVYLDFFRLNPLYEFKKLSETCTYFKGCPINKLDIAIAYELPELVGKYKKLQEQNIVQLRKEYDENCNQTEIDPPVKIIKSR